VSDKQPRPEQVTETVVRKKLEPPRKFKVIMHNDNYTTMEFVVYVLQKVFRKPLREATHIMLNIHHHGSGVCGVFTAAVAESKIKAVHAQARKHGYPLRCTMEPE